MTLINNKSNICGSYLFYKWHKFYQGDDSNFNFERDFESMEELSESMSDEEEETQVIVDQSPYRFMNGNDGKGMDRLVVVFFY